MSASFSIVDRGAIERREDAQLAPYAMRSAESRGRRRAEAPAAYRTAFQRDRDRVIHSTAFRRLEYKTQVFVNHEGDHYRTRLTHTLEVAQISRSIARVLGLNEDLVEAIALAHDLGHSPFGHAGEDALDELMAEHGGFNHNHQSLRVVDVLEKKYVGFDGLNLSWEIRESILKHGERIEGLDAEFDPGSSPLLEAQLADLADSLAYTNHDIDDGLRSGFISLDDLREIRLWRLAEEAVRADGVEKDLRMLASRAVSYLIDLQVRDLVEATRARLDAAGIETLEAVRGHAGRLVGFSPELEELKEEMEAFLMRRLYRYYRTLKMQEKSKRFVREIFLEYLRRPEQLPPAFQEEIDREGPHRVICDYIAGMTDRYCQDEYRRLFHPFERI